MVNNNTSILSFGGFLIINQHINLIILSAISKNVTFI